MFLDFPSELLDHIHLGDRYVYNEYVICREKVNNSLQLIIPDHIEKYNYDNKYIVAKQSPSLIIAKYYWNNIPQSKQDSIAAIISKCESMNTCFWIIDKQGNNVYGPLSNREYKNKCDSLSISLLL